MEMCSRIFDLQPKEVPSRLLRPHPPCQLRLQSLCRCKDLSCDQLIVWSHIACKINIARNHRLISVHSQYVECIFFAGFIFLKHFFVANLLPFLVHFVLPPKILQNLSFCRCLQAKGMGAVPSYSAHPDACSRNFS